MKNFLITGHIKDVPFSQVEVLDFRTTKAGLLQRGVRAIYPRGKIKYVNASRVIETRSYIKLNGKWVDYS